MLASEQGQPKRAIEFFASGRFSKRGEFLAVVLWGRAGYGIINRNCPLDEPVFMKFLFSPIAVLVLSACVPDDDTVEIGVSEDPLLVPICETAKYETLIGKSIHILKFSPDATRRILMPDSVATMDYRPERTNIYVGKDGIIDRVSCG
ncbi:MAG: hypothetical protein ACI84R_000928 [Candidatus Azotimanducaceae bacterium]|jgi:hypothetical protein